jgi:hypothetical protein
VDESATGSANFFGPISAAYAAEIAKRRRREPKV